MRFEFYHPGLDGVEKLSVDGTVSNSIHFSHWEWEAIVDFFRRVIQERSKVTFRSPCHVAQQRQASRLSPGCNTWIIRHDNAMPVM